MDKQEDFLMNLVMKGVGMLPEEDQLEIVAATLGPEAVAAIKKLKEKITVLIQDRDEQKKNADSIGIRHANLKMALERIYSPQTGSIKRPPEDVAEVALNEDYRLSQA